MMYSSSYALLSVLFSVLRSIAAVQEPQSSRIHNAMMRVDGADEVMFGIEPNGAVLAENTPTSQKPVQEELHITKEAPAEQKVALTANQQGVDITKSSTAVLQDSQSPKQGPNAESQSSEAKPDQTSNQAQSVPKDNQAPAAQPQPNEPKKESGQDLKEDRRSARIPTFSPEVGEMAKKAEASMAIAVNEELEGTHAADASSEHMAEALEQSAKSTIEKTELYLNKVSERTLKASIDSKEKVDKIVESITASMASSLDESRQLSLAAANQLQHAKTQAQMIESLTAAEHLSKAALEAAGKIAKDVHEAVGTIKDISKETTTMMQKALEDMQTAKRKTATDLTNMSQQLVSVGLAFSSKMAARVDAEAIANRLGETAEKITVASKDMAAKTDTNVTTLRSTVDQLTDTISAQAVSLQSKGEEVAQELADGAKRSQNAQVKNEGTWIQSEISAVGIVGDAAARAKAVLVGKEAATPPTETTWQYYVLGFLMMMAIVGVAAYAYFFGKV